ncbi:MAG: isoprenylcysteine carboxylmethyltransferase family protein, partial [Bacteroidota bacterium]
KLTAMISFFLSLNFSLFIIGALVLFEKPQAEFRLKLMSISILSCMLFQIIASLFYLKFSPYTYITGLSLLLLSLFLFLWTAYWMRQKIRRKLHPIYTIDDMSRILTRGPFKWIRHPFYTSYILSFLGGAIAINQYWIYPLFILPFFIYLFAARTEEAHLSAGKNGPAYLEYKEKTGRFIPRLLPPDLLK